MDAVHQGSDFGPASFWSLIHGIGGIAKRFHLNRSGSRIRRFAPQANHGRQARRLAEGGQPSRRDSLDVVLAVIEDAHSADPALFGPGAVAYFARLHEARGGLIF
jgi:hypothetical protein